MLAFRKDARHDADGAHAFGGKLDQNNALSGGRSVAAQRADQGLGRTIDGPSKREALDQPVQRAQHTSSDHGVRGLAEKEEKEKREHQGDAGLEPAGK